MAGGSDGTAAYTPGYFFRGLRADATLEGLYGCENISHYETVADRLGFLSPARTVILESPIGDDAAEGGYSLMLTCQDWLKLINKSSRPQDILPEDFAAVPEWRQTIAFVEQWHAGNQCGRLMDGLWLEVDMSGPPPAVPVPSVFFGIRHSTEEEYMKVITNGLAAFELEMPPAQKELVRTYFRTIGPLCQGVVVGFMIARPGAPLRLCTWGANLPDVVAGLRQLGITTLENHSAWRDFPNLGLHCMHVNIDIGAVYGAKVGIELKFLAAATVREQQQTRHWPDFIGRLVDKGWCLPQRGRAVLNWPDGHSYHPDPYDFSSPRYKILRTINHVKLDFQPGQPPRAKVYFMYTAAEL